MRYATRYRSCSTLGFPTLGRPNTCSQATTKLRFKACKSQSTRNKNRPKCSCRRPISPFWCPAESLPPSDVNPSILSSARRCVRRRRVASNCSWPALDARAPDQTMRLTQQKMSRYRRGAALQSIGGSLRPLATSQPLLPPYRLKNVWLPPLQNFSSRHEFVRCRRAYDQGAAGRQPTGGRRW